MEDSKIIALFFDRQERAIAEVSAKYGDTCSRIATNILKNEQDAEECVNDTYLALWNKIPPEEPDPLRTYVFRIVRNLAIAKYRANTSLKRNSHYDVALDELEDCLAAPHTPEQECESRELAKALDQFLDTLSRENRVMFVRRYWFSESVTDIAKRFHMSDHAVCVRLSRIREKLKKYLKKEGYEL